MSEREIKTVLTLDDASFSKGLKAATNSVSAARAEMDASVASATGLGKGLKKYTAQITGLNKTIKAEKQQMAVLNKEYKTQQSRLKDLSKALQDTIEKNGEGSKEAEKAANAYASQSARVDELRTKMAKLTTTMAQDSNRLQSTMTAPFVKMAQAATAAVAAAGAALAKFTLDSEEASSSLKQAQAANRVIFQEWAPFLEQEAENAWKNLGLSKAAYLEAATDIGEFLQDAGAPVEKVAEISAEVLEAAGQLSEKYGVPLTQILEDIKSAANGSRTAMSRYGIQLTSVDSNQKSVAYATSQTRKELHNEETDLDTIKEILDQSKQSQNDYAEGQRTVASATAELTAVWENALAGKDNPEELGEAAIRFLSTWAANMKANAWRIGEAVGYIIHKYFGQDSSAAQKIRDEAVVQITGGLELESYSDAAVRISAWWDDVKAQNAVNQGVIQEGAMVQVTGGLELESPAQAVKKLETWWADIAAQHKLNAQAIMEGALTQITGLTTEELTDMGLIRPHELADAIEQSAEDIGDSSGSLQKTMDTLADSIAAAAQQIAGAAQYVGGATGGGQFNALRDIGGNEGNFHHPHFGGGMQPAGGFAGGAWNIPSDNYIARLHAGEMVLTADQARRYRAQAASGGNTYNDSAAIYIDKYNQYSGADADGLLQLMQSMQRRQRMGYGLA